jgi:hypothetical protein
MWAGTSLEQKAEDDSFEAAHTKRRTAESAELFRDEFRVPRSPPQLFCRELRFMRSHTAASRLYNQEQYRLADFAILVC